MSGFEESLRSVSLLSDSSIAGYTGPPGYPGSTVPNWGHIFTFVKITGKNTVGLATTKASDYVIGVLQNKPQVTGQAATVAIRGISAVRSGAGTAGAITAGDPVTCDGSGRAIKATGGDLVCGHALQGSSTDDELISVLIKG